MARAGLTADPWQREVLLSDSSSILILCCRQAGKSSVIAALAILSALLQAPALVLLVSRAQRQSSELFRKVKSFYRAIARPRKVKSFRPVPIRDLEQQDLIGADGLPVQESVLSLELANGSRIVSLPGNPDTIVGFSGVSLLIIDEAARVPDNLYRAVRPMLAVSRGRIVCASTPFGMRGFFHEEWVGHAADGTPLPNIWHKVGIDATKCPRISAEFLARERASLGERWFRQEYMLSFEEAIGAVFSAVEIQRSLVDDEPWTLGGFSS